MSEDKHTPGPWLYAIDKSDPQRFSNALWSNVEPNPEILTFNINHPAHEANARLIAAAPDLLAALEELIELHVSVIDDDAELSNADAAVAKAKGKS